MNKKICCIMVFISIILAGSCSKVQPLPEEKQVLDALKQCVTRIESNPDPAQVDACLVSAGKEMEQYRKLPEINDCFLNEALKCRSALLVRQKAWNLKARADTSSRQEDLDHTMEISLEFARKSLREAERCLEITDDH